MALVTLSPEARRHLGTPEGTVTFQWNLHQPLQPLPQNQTVMILEEVALTGAVFKLQGGPGGLTIRYTHELGGKTREVVADLSPLHGVRMLFFGLTWSATEIGIKVLSQERPGILVKDQ